MATDVMVRILCAPVVLDNGAVIALPEDYDLGDGHLLQLGIRPEHASLCAMGKGHVDAMVEMIEELGATRLWNLRIEDIPFSLLAEARPSPANQGGVGVAFDLRHAHIFDGKSGKRVAHKATAKFQLAASASPLPSHQG